MLAERLVAQLEASVERGDAKGVQACVSVGADVVFATAIGEAARGVAMRDETAVLWMSAGKPITAAAVATLVDAGRLDWDDPVCEWVPGFEQNGKEAITVR
ncbi:MAG: serine hydrolase domain-containing protein, partial [Planctomycetota bacterium]